MPNSKCSQSFGLSFAQANPLDSPSIPHEVTESNVRRQLGGYVDLERSQLAKVMVHPEPLRKEFCIDRSVVVAGQRIFQISRRYENECPRASRIEEDDLSVLFWDFKVDRELQVLDHASVLRLRAHQPEDR